MNYCCKVAPGKLSPGHYHCILLLHTLNQNSEQAFHKSEHEHIYDAVITKVSFLFEKMTLLRGVYY